MAWSRRAALAGGLGLLAACERGESGSDRFVDPLEAAVASPSRPAEERARDAWRRPVETLRFFGLQPGQTVAEFWPGAGWLSAILAPYLASTEGRLIAAHPDPMAAPVSKQLVARYRQCFGQPRGHARITTAVFGPGEPPPAPPGSVDLALFPLTLHAWMAAGLVEKAFADAFAVLRPGGVLGVEQHRAPPGVPQDPLARGGYVQQPYVQRLAEEARFAFDGASEINADPLDLRETPAATRVGSTDRMTLRFRKP